MPIGSMTTAKELSAPVVPAASALSPSGDTSRASKKPITDWVEREMMIVWQTLCESASASVSASASPRAPPPLRP